MAYLYKVTFSNKKGGVNKNLPEWIKFTFFSGHLNKQHSCHPWLFIDSIGIISTEDFGNTSSKISDTTNSYSIPATKEAPGFNQLMAHNSNIHSRKQIFKTQINLR